MFLQKVNSINVLLYKDHHVHKQLSVINQLNEDDVLLIIGL